MAREPGYYTHQVYISGRDGIASLDGSLARWGNVNSRRRGAPGKAAVGEEGMITIYTRLGKEKVIVLLVESKRACSIQGRQGDG